MTSTTGQAADYWGPPTEPLRLPRPAQRLDTLWLLLAALAGAAVIGAIWLGIALAAG
ncbi:hypothetical protein [Amycolatopsis saalfeldensis]|uniref:Uncharacterized protein n=1 Tax=Amycolatopsis saalfeldensis TaxID=394193 RepID=A0A1H8QGF3_9PSEU|nr:hypothetical protein [Amycolatopsis saalfeldensis]SEO53319.1 hypothetical protein SAMN04489732_101350 [Amycolatopsis saalfeldensis]